MGQSVMYWQRLSKQPADLAKSYGSIFNWNISPPDASGSRSVQTGSTEGTPGIWQVPSEAHAMVQLFIRVDDVRVCLKRVEAGGECFLCRK